ncbi:hypothetical protein BHE74_00032906 [Ensete ventricosum]|nr:hypothetical protein BHE74_00032906 [Ensete ventricosum]
MSGLPADLGGSAARTPGYRRFTCRPWAVQQPKVPRFLGMDSSIAQPRWVSRCEPPQSLGDDGTPASCRSKDDTVGNSLGVLRELAEGIKNLLGSRKGVYRKKTETH